MKPILRSLLALLLFSSPSHAEDPAPRPDLIAHEWGTLTQVIGSDGSTIPWWTPRLGEVAKLPEFVRPGIQILGKTMRTWEVRMETPVIYFYAAEPTNLTVEVDESRIPFTEVYPNTTPPFFPKLQINAKAGPDSALRRWEFQIRPPGDPIGDPIGDLMPAVGERGAHYQHAREVPDAWWVVRPTPSQRDEDLSAAQVPEVEKFIFYRGAGSTTMPSRIHRIEEDSISFHTTEQRQFVIENTGSEIKWSSFIPAPGDDDDRSQQHPFPSADPNAQSGENELVTALVTELNESGLTTAEAEAMVATWRGSWLGEPGLRVLEILPRAWIDKTLPLSVTPAPASIERVFVARWELFPPTLENRVLTLLDNESAPDTAEAALKNLDIGRFSTALFDRVATIRDQRFRANWYRVFAEMNQKPASDTVSLAP